MFPFFLVLLLHKGRNSKERKKKIWMHYYFCSSYEKRGELKIRRVFGLFKAWPNCFLVGKSNVCIPFLCFGASRERIAIESWHRELAAVAAEAAAAASGSAHMVFIELNYMIKESSSEENPALWRKHSQ